jgi:hypothetical protein
MTCGSCGATIAAKAIVCYRCGTPTAIPEPRRKPEPREAARTGAMGWLVLMVAMLALLAAGVWLLRGAEPGWSAGRVGGYAALAGVLIVILVAAVMRGMRR